eukprot:SAG11_NODE_38626_length_251_cov_1.026316_1_plen_23_part_01
MIDLGPAAAAAGPAAATGIGTIA